MNRTTQQLFVILSLSTGSVLNSMADTSTWIGGTGNWSLSANWNPASLPGAASDVLIDSGSVAASYVTVDSSPSIAGLRVDVGDTLSINNGRALTVGANALTNNGTVMLSGAGSTTRLLFNGSQVIGGSGQIVMANFLNVRVQSSVSGQRLTHASGHTIRGAGNILYNYGNMVNQGTILAQGSVALTIDPLKDFVNQGVLRAEGSGGLALSAGAFTNAGQVIEILDGSKLKLASGATVYGGRLESAGSGLILPSTGSALDGVTVVAGSVVTQVNGADVTLRNGLTNNATWNLASTGSANYLYFANAQTLSGTGELIMSDNIANYLRPQTHDMMLTHAADHTIRGAGNILYNYGNMVNHGTILAQGSVALKIDPSTAFENRGVLRAEGSGGLALSAGAFTNAGHVIEVLDGSNLKLASGTTVYGGRLESAGSGRILPGNGSALDGVTVAAGSVVSQVNNADVKLYNGLVNNATWNFEGSGSSTYLYYNGSQTLSGTGEVVMSNYSANQIRPFAIDQTLTHAAGHTIRGAGNLLINSGNMVHQGTILAQGSVALTIDPRTAFVNQGVLRAEGSGGLALAGGSFTNAGQVIEILDGSKLKLASGATVYGGTIKSAGAGRIIPGNGSKLDGVTLAAGSVVTQVNNVDVTISDVLINDATWNIEGSGSSTYLYYNDSMMLSGTGEVVMSNYISNQIRPLTIGQTLTHAAGHTIRGSGTLLSNIGNMFNYGRILAVGSAKLKIDPQSYFNNMPGGILGGTGTFTFTDDLINNAGVIAPGLSAGTLTVAGDLGNTATAALDIELGGSAAGEYDLLIVQGSFALDGFLTVSLLDGYIPDLADTFEVLSATGLNGTFANAVPAAGTNIAYGVVTGFGQCDVTYDYLSDPKTVTLSNMISDPSLLRVVDIQTAQAGVEVTFAPSAQSWRYTLQFRGSLTGGDWGDVPGQGPRPGIGRYDMMIDTNTPTAGFYRVLGEQLP